MAHPDKYGFSCRHCGHELLNDTTINGLTCPQCKRADAMYHDINVRGGRLDAFTGLGGYTLLYVDEEGDTFCAECAAKLRDESYDTTPVRLSHGTYDEGPTLPCDECGADIESSYGDPDAPEGE